MTHAQTQPPFIPAMGRDWLLPMYDMATAVLRLDRARAALLDQAELQPGLRVLDVGCGTGTLAVLTKRLHPEVEVVALDPDPKALARAGRKAAKASVTIRLDQGFADRLPYPSESFDRVFSSFMLHHLDRTAKGGTLREIRRVLKPGGRLFLVDFARASGANGLPGSHSPKRLAGSAEDRVLELMTESDLAASIIGRRAALAGRLRVVYYAAVRPSAPSSFQTSPNSSPCARARSRSICSGVAPSESRMSSMNARAASPSPE